MYFFSTLLSPEKQTAKVDIAVRFTFISTRRCVVLSCVLSVYKLLYQEGRSIIIFSASDDLHQL